MELKDVVIGKEALRYDLPQPAPDWQEDTQRTVQAADTLRFLRLVEMLYHRTSISEWGMAFVRWIVFVGEHLRPVACYKLADVAAHFHLSERQTWRNLQALRKSQLLRITVCFDKNGKKTKYRRYDCTPFLNYIAGLMREHLQLDQPPDTCVCPDTMPASSTSSMTLNPVVAAPAADVCPSCPDTSVPRADVIEDTSVVNADVLDTMSVSCMTLEPAVDECTATQRNISVPNNTLVIEAPESCMTVCPSAAACAAGACSSTFDTTVAPQQLVDGTAMSAPAASSNDAAHESEMSWMSVFCVLSASNSSLNLEYSNYNNINISNSNAQDTCPYPAACCPVQADEQLTEEDQQACCVNRRKDCAAPEGEPGCQSEGRRDRGAKARERERINALLAESREASDANLGAHAKFTIHRIATEFNDTCPPSSCTQATTLYRHLLRINAVEDRHTLTDPDLFFTEMMQETYERLRHLQFRRIDAHRRPNGMPLFFTDLRGQVLQLVEHIQRLREREALPANPAEARQEEEQRAASAWRPERPLQNADDPLSVADSHRLVNHVRSIPLDDPRDLVAQARRLEVVMSDEEASQILEGTASEELYGQIVTAVRQGFYYEIKDSCVVQPGYGIR